MAVSATDVQKAYLAYFGRPADPVGLAYWQTSDAATMKAGFAGSEEYAVLYSGMDVTARVNQVYQNVLGRLAEPAGLLYWATEMTSGRQSVSTLVDAIQANALNEDITTINNRVTYATAFTAALDTTAEIVGYSGDTAAASARAAVLPITTDATLTTATAAIADTIITVTAAGTSSSGSTFTLTTNIDTVSGTSGNDTILADAAASSVADQVNGGLGTDTFKYYAAAATDMVLPQLSNVENIYVKGIDKATALDFSVMTGVTGVEFDAPTTIPLTVTLSGATQTYTQSNDSTGKGANLVYGAADTAASLVVSADGKLVNNVYTMSAIDAKGASLATLNVEATGAANYVTLNNSGSTTATTTINVSGDKSVYLDLTTNSAQFTKLATVNASTNTGGVTATLGGAVTVANFAFTGGTGNDALLVAANELHTISAGSQLDGGAGGDALIIMDAAPTVADYTAINAAKNFEVLGVAATSTIDISALTSINSFLEYQAATATFNNALSTSTFKLDNSAGLTAVTISNAVGETASTINVDNQAGAAATLATLTLAGVSSVALSSTGNTGASNVITTLANADNSSITVTGDKNLTITNALAATATGSKVDATNFTGVLKVVGNATAFAAGSALGDTLIGGSKADTLKAAINGGKLTGNGGNDIFDVSVAKGGTAAAYNTTQITDLTKGDVIKFQAAAASFTAAKVDLSGAATVGAALDLLAAGGATAIRWGQWGGNTYVVDDEGTGATFAATDVMVKLTGTLDLSTSVFDGTTDSVTFA